MIGKDAGNYFQFIQWKDSGKLRLPMVKKAPAKFANIMPDSARLTSVDLALNRISSAKSSSDIFFAEYNSKNKEYRQYLMGWHQKFAISFACFVMFLIGAPLGSIIRKGGIGTPLVFAVIFFAIFHLLNTTGEKLAKEGVLAPFTGMWLPSIVLIPVGIFLTFKAMRDSQLLNKEFYYRTATKIRKFIRRYTHKEPNTP